MKEGYIYYSPHTLPYNSSAPLRNCVPYLPIEFSPDGIHISDIISSEYINRDLRTYIEQRNQQRTQDDIEEIEFIKRGNNIDTIMTNLMKLGSILEDDEISISDDEDGETGEGEEETEGEYKPHYPPKTLKQIYSLPHKNRGDMKDNLNISNEEELCIKNIISNEMTDEEIERLLNSGLDNTISDVWEGLWTLDIGRLLEDGWLDVEGGGVGEE